MKPFIIVLSALLLIGCATQQKKEERRREQAKIYFQTHPNELAELCNDELPIPEFEFINGNVLIEYDTIYKDGVVLPCPEPTIYNPNPSVKCPECKSIIKTISKTDTVKIVDTRKQFILNSENQLLKSLLTIQTENGHKLALEVAEQKQTKNHYLWALILLGSLNLIYVVLKIYKKFYLK